MGRAFRCTVGIWGFILGEAGCPGNPLRGGGRAVPGSWTVAGWHSRGVTLRKAGDEGGLGQVGPTAHPLPPASQ